MFESLEALTDPLIRIRVEAMYRELLDTDSNYKVLLLESDQCFQQLWNALPEEQQKTAFLYEDTQLSLQAILERSIYLQGFKDALYLFNELQISTHS
ncbi:hypothetical protein H70357_26215 [Paenibacillus sp. FSL H7-0357]|uniref:hypothetical protein n=1 Tax=Paenibacillus sp. FSL H7-0357 TaxID=1536774 RepID=UPI0004F67B3F|nr:hypothetical protein [Paenibacillus sp. FSL H7-0357]AIQ19821.1 hypothetical protein H70357_26215 [Paenibacillus sp. FSL H7-0357]